MKRYQNMKDSGVDWIGKVPEHWEISKFKFVTNLYTGNSLNSNQKKLYSKNKGQTIPYISTKNINISTRQVEYDTGLFIPKSESTFKKARAGSFLLCIEGGSAGKKITFLEKEVCFVNKLCCFDSNQETKYQYYLLQSNNFQKCI